MNKSIFGSFEIIKEVPYADFSICKNDFDQYIKQNYINAYKYTFNRYTYYNNNEYNSKMCFILHPKMNDYTKIQYWQVYMFFSKANQVLRYLDNSSNLHAFSEDYNFEGNQHCDNIIICETFSSGFMKLFNSGGILKLNSKCRYFWYFPFIDENPIMYCFLFELPEESVEKFQNQILLEQYRILKKSAFNRI